jgi:hypothetical protein
MRSAADLYRALSQIVAAICSKDGVLPDKDIGPRVAFHNDAGKAAGIAVLKRDEHDVLVVVTVLPPDPEATTGLSSQQVAGNRSNGAGRKESMQ